MPWNEEQQRQARLMSSGSWPKREARKTTFRDVLRALGIASSPLDLTSQEPEGVRPDYGLTGAGLERRRRYPGEYFPGEATQADVAGALWNIVESAGVENLPGIGPKKLEQRAPGNRTNAGIVLRPKEWNATSDEANEALTKIQRPGHAYRGMTAEEYEATVGAGHGVRSTGQYSHQSEGTNFAQSPHDAESYANYGRDDPRKTGRPTYLVEVAASPEMTVGRDGYIKSHGPTQPTRVWRMSSLDGAVVMEPID